MKIIAVSNYSRNLQGEAQQVCELFREGLTTFHVRKPYATKKQLAEYIENIPEEFHSRLVIHSYPGLLSRFNLRGIYINHTARRKFISGWLKRKWHHWTNPSKILTTGIFSSDTLIRKGDNYDYVFFGPVFFMGQGGKKAMRFDEVKLNDLLKKARVPVYARGGITPENINFISEMGFEGVVLQRYLWENDDPVSAFLNISEALEGQTQARKISLYS